jgi:hypothetical protein
MKKIYLKSNQIITLNDYPVYSDEVLCKYFNKCQTGERLPLVPVIKKDAVINYIDDDLRGIFNKFEEISPTAEYFMLDGSHRTTALDLLDRKIEVIAIDKDEDLQEAKKHISSGQIQKDSIWDYSFIENLELLNKHFQGKSYFMTVEQKTKKMIKEGVLPDRLKGAFLKK